MNTFIDKWKKMKNKDASSDEQSLFTDLNNIPLTQRQFNMYHLFKFMEKFLINRKNVLEIGCGRGTMSLFAKKYLNAEVSLLDTSSDALEIAQREFNKNNVEAKYYLANACSTGLPDNAYDAVISIGLAEHLDNPHDLFIEQLRLLKPGGIMISLNVPKKFSIQSLNNVLKFFKKKFSKEKDKIKKDYYRNSLKAIEYKQIAKQVGFQQLKITHVTPFPIFTPVKISTDKFITNIYKLIVKVRKSFLSQPYKTNIILAKSHFLIGYKNK